MATFNTPEYSDSWAYDMDKDTRLTGEAYDEDAINNSIENILMTIPGERVFYPYFGSPLTLMVFEQLNKVNGEQLLNGVIEAIKRWETRITIREEQVELNIIQDENAITLVLPYEINRTGLTGTFARKIIL